VHYDLVCGVFVYIFGTQAGSQLSQRDPACKTGLLAFSFTPVRLFAHDHHISLCTEVVPWLTRAPMPDM
jgi:hypothetical protein